MIDAYASRTGTRRNLDALRAAGWGLFVSATGAHRNEGFRFMIDNGAWSFFQEGRQWDERPFVALLHKLGGSPLCEGIIAPDIVGGGADSLRLSLRWIDRLLVLGPRVYLAVQPGIKSSDIERFLGDRVGVFVGGDSEWKERTAAGWASLARQCGARCHVGRVNTLSRLRIVAEAGVDSFDGSGASRFSLALDKMERWRRGLAVEGAQLALFNNEQEV
jgi:hypothetical protein